MSNRVRSPRFLFGGLLLAAVGMVLAWTATAAAQEKGKRSDIQKDSPQVLAAFKGVVKQPSQSVVRITCDGKEVALGVVVGADGWVLTKASQLNGKPLCRFRDGRELEGKLVGHHKDHDLALLKVEAKDLKPVEWADSKTAPVGNWVASPGLGEVPVAVGVVSVAAREISGPKGPPPAGGGYLGVSLDAEEDGAKVTQVLPNTAASKAGLKTNDIILSVDGKAIDGLDKFLEALLHHKPGDVVKLRVKRGDKEMEVEATLGKRPRADRGDFQNAMGSELSERRTGFPHILQHDQVLKPTDCGGPLVDLDGKAIGLNIARAGRTESYAVPAEVIRPLLSDLMAGKFPPAK